MMMGVDRSVMGGLYGPRDSSLRSEMFGSSKIKSSPLEDGLRTVSCNPVVSKTLAGLIFSLAVVRGVQGQPVAGPKSFTTGRTPDPPLC
jgi:hypothetical protein